MKLLLTICFSLASIISCFGQLAIGQWRAHVPMSSFKWIGETENKIYAANAFGVLEYDREDESTQSLTKANVLSQTQITAFKCNPAKSVCIIGYSNGNMDAIVDESTIRNQPAIMNSQAIGDKSINDIHFVGDNVWLATGIGVLQLDVNSLNVLEYTPIEVDGLNQNIQRILIDNGTLYMASNEQMLSTKINNLFNAPTFNQLAFPTDITQVDQLFSVNGDIFSRIRTPLFVEDTIYILNQNQFAEHPFLLGAGIRHIEVEEDRIIATKATNIEEYTLDLEFVRQIFTYGADQPLPEMAIPSEFSRKLVVADNVNGGVEVSFENEFNATVFNRQSPYPKEAVINELSVAGDAIYALPGGTEFTFLRPRVHKFDEEEWRSNEISSATGATYVNGNELVEVNDQLYLAGDRGGIAILDDTLTLLNVYDGSNSPINDLREGYQYFGTTDIAKDDEGNLFIAHNKDEQPLKILTANGQWVEVSLEESGLTAPLTGSILVTESGVVLMSLFDDGLLVYDTKSTLNVLDDDEYRILTTSPSEGDLPSNLVVSMVEDKDGEIWLGTAEGVAVIYSIDNVFESGFKAEQIIVNQDGFNGFLFGTESVEALAIDGANRKWVGTFNSGVFLVSEDGQQQLAHFTAENSPLFDDRISDIVIHPETGEVFIATDKGLVSFRGNATDGASDLEAIKIFPNPVKPGYTGPIAISNLTEGATLRITDAGGNLVFETTSNGGQAIWNGTTLDGRQVQSGVYLALVTAADGSVGKTEKILILK